jgi:FKBP-type peptidyl-prolyl cis-trans isomerase|tara:strand:- start:289 stop:756 length:468 start_codon:yes stop_codon:yes gene_type:complete
MKIRIYILCVLLLGVYSCSEGGDADMNLIESEKFLESNLDKPNIKEIESGLQYMVVNSSAGSDKPNLDTTINADFHGTLMDGSVFWSSIENGEPLVVQLSQLIPGCQKAISLMTVGETWRIFIHPDLAYGEAGRPGIPANSALIFEITLHSISSS